MVISIESYMIKDLKLKLLDLIMYSIISNSGNYIEDCEKIENEFGYPADEVRDSLQRLVDKKLVFRQNFSKDLIEIVVYSKYEIKKPEPIKRTFLKPTIEQIKAYCSERNNKVNAECFYDFYESKGWLVGKTKMKDWKAAVRTWENKNKTAKVTKVNNEIRNYRTK